MAIGWLTILKSVPWTEVISNAPKIADGAKKLWGAVGKKSHAPRGQTDQASPDLEQGASPALEIARLEQRIQALESAATDLHEQMLESSELIKALAEQNAQLIRRAELSRVRIAWLTVATAIVGVIAVVGLLVLFGKVGPA